jgi:phosphatidate cytidylyltransferase
MLKNRIVTALALAPLTIAAILLLPADSFALLWSVIILAGAWEWTNLAGLKSLPARLGYAGLILGVFILARIFAIHWAPGELPEWFYVPVVIWWAVWGLAFRKAPEKLVKLPYPRYAKLLAGAFVLITSWVLMIWLRLNFTQYQVLYLVVLIWLADIAAYFVGNRWGHTKLVEPISPGKTIEGVYGGLAAAAVLAIVIGLVSQFEAMTIADFAFLSLLTVAFSICGDLFESLAKRIRGVKDSSGVLPGHGGVLDRIDSLLAGVSVFYAGSLLLGIFLHAGTPVETGISLQPDVPSAIEAPGEQAFPGEGQAGEGPHEEGLSGHKEEHPE